jgi:FdhE protein
VHRVLDPAQIEAFSEHDTPCPRLPDRSTVFAQRAQRLRQLAASDVAGQGQSISDYLRLMAVLADAQQAALGSCAAAVPSATDLERARVHGMPPLHTGSTTRDGAWCAVLRQLCRSVLATDNTAMLPEPVRGGCGSLLEAPVPALEAQAEALLAVRPMEVDATVAPFISAALQVAWVDLASRLAAGSVAALSFPDVCPVCGSLPVASIVRAERGYRYLHCSLCASEWHRVRVTCTQCQAVEGIAYYSIEGGSEAVRAEACPHCHSYRKIFYQEKDMAVEPTADDLASIALDLLMSAEGFHRASGNPLLWLAL